MVDWKEENAHVYIPKNLSYDEYHKNKLSQSLYEALTLCDANLEKENRMSSVNIKTSHGVIKRQANTENTENSSSQGLIYYALDLAIGRCKSRTICKKCNTTMESIIDQPLNSHEPLSTNVKGYKTLTPASPTCLSDVNTEFSDDYLMTECVDMSDIDAISTGSCTDEDCDSTTASSELERVTLNFSTSKETLNDCDDSSSTDSALPMRKERSLKNEDKDLFNGVLGTGSSCSGQGADCFEDREFDFLKTEPVKRSTSLKTNKTPPGTPGRKKVVRFADALGLDLEDVRHVLNLEDPPQIPASAMRDLKIGLEEAHRTEGARYLSACFPQPGASPKFNSCVLDEKVVFENCIINDNDLTIIGTVRVSNIAYHKEVVIRYSINNWTTFTDVRATYVQNSCDSATDRFSFTLNVPPEVGVGSKVQFAVRYRANDQEFWDSNNGRNYVIECYARTVPITESDNTWLHFM